MTDVKKELEELAAKSAPKEVEPSELVKSMDSFIKLYEDIEVETPKIDLDEVIAFRNGLFAAENAVTSYKKEIGSLIGEMNGKTERIIKFTEVIQEGQAANQEMFVTLQHVGAIFNRMFDDISEAAKDTDFVDAGAITKILNNNKKFEIDESVFEEEVDVRHSVDTSYEG